MAIAWQRPHRATGVPAATHVRRAYSPARAMGLVLCRSVRARRPALPSSLRHSRADLLPAGVLALRPHTSAIRCEVSRTAGGPRQPACCIRARSKSVRAVSTFPARTRPTRRASRHHVVGRPPYEHARRPSGRSHEHARHAMPHHSWCQLRHTPQHVSPRNGRPAPRLRRRRHFDGRANPLGRHVCRTRRPAR